MGFGTAYIHLDPHKELLLISASGLEYEYGGTTVAFPLLGIEEEEYFEKYMYSDSLETLEYFLKDISPLKIGEYFLIEPETYHLYKSNDFGKTTTLVDSSSIYWVRTEEFKFDTDSTHIFSKYSNRHTDPIRLLRSDNLGEYDSWKSIINLTNDFFYSLDPDSSGIVYLAKNDSLLISSDYGDSFTFFDTFESKIQGLYKKPKSDIIFVLTSNNLIEFQVTSKSEKTIQTIPVSNEPNHEIPTQLVLHQNYPNPFNPSTVISYQLAANSLVKLAVFDVLGREVAVLVDEPQSAGAHEISFDASALSSGVYLYRIEANGAVQTKKFTLIK